MYQIIDCSEGDMSFITGKLFEYNTEKIGMPDKMVSPKFDRKIVDENEKIIAGFSAVKNCWWQTMYLAILWVDESIRGQRLGAKLLENLEQLAREEGCTVIHTETFDFQAKNFYIKNGYEIYGELSDAAKNHTLYYLKKIV